MKTFPKPRESNVTLKDIAAELGVSLPTVSQILAPSSKRANLFAPATREKVINAAREMGYRPNTAARSMVSGRFGSLTLVLGQRENSSILPPGLLSGIDDALSEAGMHLVVAHLPDHRLTDAEVVPKLLNQLASDGLLINYNAHIPRAMIDLIERFQLPSIWINSKQEKACVYPDDEGAAYALTRKALEAGHRRVAYLNYTTGLHPASCHYSVLDRLAGYERAMREAGLPSRIICEAQEVKPPDRITHVQTWLRAPEPPEAVVTYGKNECMAVLTAMDRMGLSCPKDLALYGINEERIQHFELTLPTALLPEFEMGRKAVKLLLRHLKKPETAIPSVAMPLHIEDLT
ncbi:MAG: LacI family DNA-binding transcriptional regulator [Kiritimatiellia bacterium]